MVNLPVNPESFGSKSFVSFNVPGVPGVGDGAGGLRTLRNGDLVAVFCTVRPVQVQFPLFV